MKAGQHPRGHLILADEGGGQLQSFLTKPADFDRPVDRIHKPVFLDTETAINAPLQNSVAPLILRSRRNDLDDPGWPPGRWW